MFQAMKALKTENKPLVYAINAEFSMTFMTTA